MCEQIQQFGDTLTTTWVDAEGNEHSVSTTKLEGETQAAFELRHQNRVNRAQIDNPPAPCPPGGN